MPTDCSTIRRICSLALLSGLLIGTGCEHESSRERAEVDQQLNQAGVQLMTAQNDAAMLEKALRDIRAIKGGTKEQQATRDLMMASTELEIAGIRTKAMQQLETRMRHELSYIGTLVGNAEALQHFMDERRISVADLGSDQIEQMRQGQVSQLQTLDRQVDMMQQPISEMEELNTDQARRIRDLRRAAEALRQEQYDLGPLEGFDVFQRSIETDRTANGIELEMSNRQIMLDLESNPSHDLAKTQRDNVQSYVNELDATHEGLQAMAGLQAAQAEVARALLQRTDTAINDSYARLAEQDAGPMTTDIQNISGMLESAAKNARSGSRNVPKDAKNSAILLQTRAQLDLLMLQSHRMRSLQERLALLDRMASSSFLSNRDAFQLQSRKLAESAEQARTLALGTGQQIEQSLRGVRGGEVDSILTTVQQLVQQLGGASAPTPQPAAAAPPSTPSSTPQAAPEASSQSMGAASPKALVDELNKIVGSDTSLETKLKKMSMYSDMSDPKARQMLQMQMQMLEAITRLGDAMQSKFGNKQSPMMNMLSSQMELPTIDPKLIEQTSDTTARVPVTNAMSQTEDEYMIKTNVGWQIDWKKKIESNPQMQEGMQMLPMIIKAMKSVTKKVLDGTITNGMGVDMAIGQAMAPAGGAPGRP